MPRTNLRAETRGQRATVPASAGRPARRSYALAPRSPPSSPEPEPEDVDVEADATRGAIDLQARIRMMRAPTPPGSPKTMEVPDFRPWDYNTIERLGNVVIWFAYLFSLALGIVFGFIWWFGTTPGQRDHIEFSRIVFVSWGANIISAVAFCCTSFGGAWRRYLIFTCLNREYRCHAFKMMCVLWAVVVVMVLLVHASIVAIPHPTPSPTIAQVT